MILIFLYCLKQQLNYKDRNVSNYCSIVIKFNQIVFPVTRKAVK